MDNMKFNEFIDYVREHIFDARPELQTTCEISVNQVNKNNGLQLTGLTIREEHTNIAPTIYLDGYFKDYENGRDIDSVVGEVFKIYENSAGEAAKGFDTEFLAKFENVEDRIGCRLINGAKNEGRLENMPHYKFGDLAVIFHIEIAMDQHGLGTITINDAMMEQWGIEPSKLMEAARANMEYGNAGKIRPIESVLIDIMAAKGELPDLPEDFFEMLEERATRDEITPGMYVLSNRTGVNGAVAMIQPGLLEEFAEKAGTNIYILPSSIHECILLPDDGNMTAEGLKEMVSEVNVNEVLPEEVLSDNVYMYDREAKQLMIAETREPMILEDVTKGFTMMYDPTKKVEEYLEDNFDHIEGVHNNDTGEKTGEKGIQERKEAVREERKKPIHESMQRGKDQMEAKASEKPSKPIIDKPEQGKEIN